jgi:uncharacterized membrane protein HdeD (DUF308 family)
MPSIVVATTIAEGDVPGGLGTFAICVCVLSIVFLWSSVSKLADLGGTAETISAFGFGSVPRRRWALVAGVAELALGVALAASLAIGPAASRAAGAAAALLLFFFVAIVARSLIRGQRFACHCFGSHEKPLSRSTLLRAVCLAVIATLLAEIRLDQPAGFRTLILAFVSAAAAVGATAIAASIGRMVHFNTHLRQIGIIG